MLQKLSRSARKTKEKQQIEAMQRYLDHLKSDEGSPDRAENRAGQLSSRKWSVAPVMYPPFED